MYTVKINMYTHLNMILWHENDAPLPESITMDCTNANEKLIADQVWVARLIQLDGSVRLNLGPTFDWRSYNSNLTVTNFICKFESAENSSIGYYSMANDIRAGLLLTCIVASVRLVASWNSSWIMAKTRCSKWICSVVLAVLPGTSLKMTMESLIWAELSATLARRREL